MIPDKSTCHILRSRFYKTSARKSQERLLRTLQGPSAEIRQRLRLRQSNDERKESGAALLIRLKRMLGPILTQLMTDSNQVTQRNREQNYLD